jgi:hypothetical protein
MVDGDSIPTKYCKKCDSTKPVAEFYTCKRYKDGRRTTCKACEAKKNAEWRSENPDRVKQAKREWDLQNKERILAYSKQYKLENIDEIRQKARVAAAIYRRENLEAVRARNIEFKRKNIEKNRANAREWARANVEANRLRARTWAEQNNARFMARITAYNKAHPELARRSGALRHKAMRAAMISWRDEFIIAEIYDLAKQRTKITGQPWQVDHIVPIRSKIVCGLHVHWNLAVIPARLNRRKSNTRWPDMP